MNSGIRQWHSIDIAAKPEALEAIEFALNSLDALGTATSFRPVGEIETIIVSGFFEELPGREQIKDELDYALSSYGLGKDLIGSIETSKVEQQDWLAEWKRHWRPTEIGRFVVSPPWTPETTAGRIEIRIEPNMAFGTGTHETTQLCISAIDRLYRPGSSFLDVGTGTGILAIAAAKLGDGSEQIYAIDDDSDAIEIARANAAANGVPHIRFEVATIGPEASAFDFVCANLTLDVILPILDLLLERSKSTLVLSGILAEQEAQITGALNERHITGAVIERRRDWIAVVIHK